MENNADDLIGKGSPRIARRNTIFRNRNRSFKSLRRKGKYKKNPKTLGDLVFLVAKLGGYMGRAHDPPPGHQIMWR